MTRQTPLDCKAGVGSAARADGSRAAWVWPQPSRAIACSHGSGGARKRQALALNDPASQLSGPDSDRAIG